MNPTPSQKRQPKPLIPSPRDEAILQQFADYRLLTAQEITHLCYSGWVGKTPKTADSRPTGSLTYARSRLSALSGNQDVTDKDLAYDYPLWRLGFPTGKRGTNEKIFALSLTGSRILDCMGIPGAWYLRPSRLRTYAHSYLYHDLTRNRFVVALHALAKTKPNLTIESLLAYELATTLIPVEMPVQGKLVKVSVVPDALIRMTNTRLGQRVLLLIEIDQNTQAEGRFKQHIASRLAYVKSPQFTFVYRNIPCRIVYATQAVTEAAARARLQTMVKHTMDVLTERKREKEAVYFRFTTINFSTLYQDAQTLFEHSVWHTADDLKLERPVPLFTEAKAQTS